MEMTPRTPDGVRIRPRAGDIYSWNDISPEWKAFSNVSFWFPVAKRAYVRIFEVSVVVFGQRRELPMASSLSSRLPDRGLSTRRGGLKVGRASFHWLKCMSVQASRCTKSPGVKKCPSSFPQENSTSPRINQYENSSPVKGD
jgi:hypothetical protein